MKLLKCLVKTSVRMCSSAPQEVLFQVKNDIGIITLNRPKALNALNANMTKQILPKMKEWENSVKFVIIEGAGEKAFCAGTQNPYCS